MSLHCRTLMESSITRAGLFPVRSAEAAVVHRQLRQPEAPVEHGQGRVGRRHHVPDPLRSPHHRDGQRAAAHGPGDTAGSAHGGAHTRCPTLRRRGGQVRECHRGSREAERGTDREREGGREGGRGRGRGLQCSLSSCPSACGGIDTSVAKSLCLEFLRRVCGCSAYLSRHHPSFVHT